MWNASHSLSSVLHGMKFLSAVQNSRHNSHGEHLSDNMEAMLQQPRSILHPDNRRELAAQGFYDFNSKPASTSWGDKLKQLQRSKTGAEERRKNFQKSKVPNNKCSFNRNDPNESSSIEYDEQESPIRPRQGMELRSFSTDMSTSLESSDSSFGREHSDFSFSQETSRMSRRSPTVGNFWKQEETQKLRDNNETLELDRGQCSIKESPSVVLPTSPILERRRKQIDQKMERRSDDGDYVISPKSNFDFGSNVRNVSDMKTKNESFYPKNILFESGGLDSLEVPERMMDRSDSDATITVTSPGYLSDTESDLTVLESSIWRSPGRPKVDTKRTNKEIFQGEVKEFYDENDNVKVLKDHSSASGDKLGSLTGQALSQPSAHYISHVEVSVLYTVDST